MPARLCTDTQNKPLIVMRKLFTVLLVLSYFCPGFGQSSAADKNLVATKIKDVVIYNDNSFYSAFPSVIKKPNGEYIVAFRRAPNRKALGEKGNSHVDPNSYLVQVRSTDGEHWTHEPELIYAHAFGGSQDPCLLQLRDGTLLCASYGWAFLRPDAGAPQHPNYFNAGPATFLGGYVVRSNDGGKSWQGPFYPPSIAPESKINPLGDPIPAYNRGAMYEGKDGRIFWVVAASDSVSKRTSNHLLVSEDKGTTWAYKAPVAVDKDVAFNEASVYQTPKGDWVAFLRTANFQDQAVIARSTDGGESFEWRSMGFQGHPLQAIRLPDNRVFLVYGYRHQPFGIRARILNEECTDFDTAPEIIIREDGGNTDLGYPWAVMMDEKRILVTYYFNKADGTRHIAGSILQLED
jgi:sialidase-1